MNLSLKLIPIFILSFLLNTTPTIGAELESGSLVSFTENFSEGLKAYQAKDYPLAIDKFTKALALDGLNVAAYTNLGLANYQLGKKGLAIAYFRRALFLDPSFDTASAALAFAISQLEVKDIPHEIQLWESVRAHLLAPNRLQTLSFIAALLFFALGWTLIRYFQERKVARAQELPTPMPPVSLFFYTIAFFLSLTLTFAKIHDQNIIRGTVISEKINVQSLPDLKAPSLFELFPGLEVIVRQIQNDWIQVTYPGGLTGWLPKSAVFITNGGQ